MTEKSRDEVSVPRETRPSRRPIAVHIGAMDLSNFILLLVPLLVSGRLTRFMRPIQYRVTLLPILEENPRLCGQVWIDLETLRDTNVIQLNARNMQIYLAVMGPLPEEPPEPSGDQSAVEMMCMDGTATWQSDWNATELPFVSVNEDLQLATLVTSQVIYIFKKSKFIEIRITR